MFIFLGYKQGVFWLNIVKFEVNLRYRYCSNLFRDVRKESEFRQYRYQNSTKSRKEKKKKWEREIFLFSTTPSPKFLLHRPAIEWVFEV